MLGLLGPNGAGKTTTLRMLYGFVPADDGSIYYGGQRFSENRARAKRSIGVCTQEDSLDYDFTVAQNLLIYASYFRPRVEDLEGRVAELLDRFDLTAYADASPHVLSGGARSTGRSGVAARSRPKARSSSALIGRETWLQRQTAGLRKSASVR